jgi:ATP-dependent helicase Lhr and Lhr-like helicase
VGGGYPGESLDALWSLVWRGIITNDTFHPLRAYTIRPSQQRATKRQHNLPAFRSRRTTPPTAQGRWTLLPGADPTAALGTSTERSHAIALQLLNRYGVLMRESAIAEDLPGGFSSVYDVLKAMEESGRIRRGYFVAGLGATQFALPSAVDLLRSLRNGPIPEKSEMVIMAATDPANLYGSVLRWPSSGEDDSTGTRSLARSVGASVVLRNGELVAYLRRNNPALQVFLPQDEPDRSNAARELAEFLAHQGQEQMRQENAEKRQGFFLSIINGQPIHLHWLSQYLLDAGFHPSPMGFNLRRIPSPVSQEHP